MNDDPHDATWYEPLTETSRHYRSKRFLPGWFIAPLLVIMLACAAFIMWMILT